MILHVEHEDEKPPVEDYETLMSILHHQAGFGNDRPPLELQQSCIIPQPFGPGDLVVVCRPHHNGGDTREAAIIVGAGNDGPGSVDLRFADGGTFGLRCSRRILQVLPAPTMNDPLFRGWLQIAIQSIDRATADRFVAELHAAVRRTAERGPA